jgi:hypothetical protein
MCFCKVSNKCCLPLQMVNLAHKCVLPLLVQHPCERSRGSFPGCPVTPHAPPPFRYRYFDVLLTQGDTGVLGEVLDASMSHKDLVGPQPAAGMASCKRVLCAYWAACLGP